MTLLLACVALGAARADHPGRRTSRGKTIKAYAGRDLLSRRLFGEGKFQINTKDLYDSPVTGKNRPLTTFERNAFGRMLKPAEWAGLAGAPDGAKLALLADYGDRSVEITAKHRLFEDQWRTVGLDRQGNVYVKNDLFVLADRAPAGTGTRVLARQLQAASQLGVKYVKIDYAPRSDTANGYYTWPRLGFNGSIPRGARARLAARFGEVKDLNDLFSREGGAAWWKSHGTEVKNLRFDLTRGSESMKAHKKYLAEKGIAL